MPANRRPFNTVFQDYALFPHMTVAQNAGYGPLVQRRDGVVAKKLVDETLDIVGLSALRDRYPSQLSGGQKQRVALARAIVCEPKLILLDEPLAALDASLRRQMQVFLKQIQRRIETTFVFVTHDQDEAITMSDRIVVMSQGSIEQVGTPKDLYYHPRTRFVAGFFGDNNLIDGVVAASGDRVETKLGILPLARQGAAGRKVLVAIRPEALRLGQGAIAISADVEEVMFGGALTRVLLHATAAPETKFDVRLAGDGRGQAPAAGDRVHLTYDPADAVIVID
jgi:ABC-type Fe3+/spermidine/putrescine transport system ATPase subunit